jgi:hypothetical protein
MNRQHISHGFWYYRLDLLPGASLQSPCLRGVRVGRQKSSAVPTPGCVRFAPCRIPGTLPAPKITQLQLQVHLQLQLQFQLHLKLQLHNYSISHSSNLSLISFQICYQFDILLCVL